MPLNVSVVSADEQIWAGEASMVVARTTEGEIGILTGHTPLLAILAGGEVRVTQTGGRKIVVNAQDGFVSVDHDTVTVVARAAELVS
ncbi:MAG: synthase subunit epsilon [Naasia sp.]|uniref:F0F1 ATP synthase subunit epsilon n=1 Tax=Naasia sp. TaxID=2546198 RepID=UPI0026315EAE|nr:F0F1 ATP synthase subunit epsilon [Naasia sp.]MCU1571609.1 synthase subunit epsilon [Naasia sp.]